MIIDGKKVAEEIQLEIKEKIQQIAFRPPCLAVVLVGHHLPPRFMCIVKQRRV